MEKYPDFKNEDMNLIREITINQILNLTKNTLKKKIVV